ncbi:conjugal transfer protein [Bacillus thuringiensis]|uniref:hypothetical protein n=1 Tax=Bacillus thuringiensis TaxID=1428 RepID=UPI0007C1E2DD|nr:hypothetical protein [Bacillus thuringiensis]AND11181.1 conjugal transfer protein [Bacillus thuringiensis serovar alesti]MEC3599234.1 conjugal transfer protein [Bacillus thuringiensis]MED1835431.1 conjugal transfer protein [Bacillus thuringiensis]MED2211051.1 conjugal transfer protein [Bacillus thuringiensis]MED2671936.1 conjugal transfer protein [Bacillus thuringiensis]
MYKIKSTLFLIVVLIALFIPNTASARNNDVPFYNGDPSTLLDTSTLQIKGKLLRPGKGYTPPSGGDAYYTADFHYPAMYNGSFNFSNNFENLVQNADYSEPYVNLANDGFLGTGNPIGNRMVTEIQRMNSTIIHNKYNGNGDFVLDNLQEHNVKNLGTGKSYGLFYWIRDIAYLSGGYAGAGLNKGVSPYQIWVVRTSNPDITKFNASNGAKSDPVNFNVEGFEYVSKNKGYTDNDPNSDTYNPYRDSAGERNRVHWFLEIYQNDSLVDKNDGYIRSQPQINNSKSSEKEAGKFGGSGTNSPIRWQPKSCGRFTAKLKVVDGVQRESEVKTTNFTIDGNCSTEVPVDPSDNMCKDDFKYKIDFSVDRIEGETAEKGTNISTPVKVSRANFKEERDKYRGELKEKINSLQSEINSLRDDRDSASSNLRSCRLEQTCYVDAKGEQHCYPKDCSWWEERLDSILLRLQKVEEKLKCETNKLKRLETLEAQYNSTEPNVILSFDGDRVGTQNVTLKEGESKTISFDWTLKRSGQIEAEINPLPRKYDNSKDVEKTNFKNNKLDTPIYTSSHQMSLCSRPGEKSSIQAVVRTINDKGTKDKLYEYLTGEIINLSRKTLRSGYGFSYEVKTTYSNEDPKSSATGPKSTDSFFPTMTNHLQYPKVDDGYKVQMEKTKNSVSESVWSLPMTYVEKFSGNVFDKDYKNHPAYNPKEIILNGGRKWYTSFDQKDGKYAFNIKSYNAGVNKLNLCLTGEVMIEGSFIGNKKGEDDFIRRSVNPSNPFPDKVGWNWQGKETMLTSLNNWWTNWKYPNPKDIPPGYHKESYKISPEIYQSIKAYNKSHGLDVDLNSEFFSKFNLK